MSEELRRKHAVFAFVIFIILFSFLLITLAFYLPTKKSGRSKPENIRPPEKRATEKISSSSLKSAVWYSQPSDIPIEAAVDIYIGVDVLLRIDPKNPNQLLASVPLNQARFVFFEDLLLALDFSVKDYAGDKWQMAVYREDGNFLVFVFKKP